MGTLIHYGLLVPSFGHDLSDYPHPHPAVLTHLAEKSTYATDAGKETSIAFDAFSPHVRTYSDANYLYVESDGMPHHPMMVGITAWQQQVPIPQPYTGNNAWRIPLKPVPAKKPLSARFHFFRGAIALAANGIPIFNPIKNDGKTDTFLAGELDEYGGHSGRADDYHYHISPLHLQKILGERLPVAYALDGYPIFGLTEADGSAVRNLDAFNGHIGPDGDYHYHSSKSYPYLNGGFHGEVQERDGQVDPQPRAQGVRPYTRPLRGAKITGWK
ncbi:MAG: YHYH protein, partial [Verrucomicrobiae bacterium]|nr:YHYH protein [Verrucomicrobiae bacterium]